ncbi:MAG TPA: glycosyltransferase [Chthoniobacteraceae bacterium]|jgi:GT2 family glycosyltransferase|nr:glycosyltransferase [Chthoniobacteraceae bacterium]
MTPDPAELERRLATRTAELNAAHRRIDELLDKARSLRETKEKLAAIRTERDTLRASPEYRLGRKLIGPFRKLARAIGGKPKAAELPASPDYHAWLLSQRPSPEELQAMRDAASQLAAPVLISIVMPVFNTPLSMLEEAVASVRAQSYPHWELLVADDASDDARVSARLLELAAGDSRIRVTTLDRNQGIALATNAAIATATGEFVGFLDHDDWLEPHALSAVARRIEEFPDADLLYSDEDKVDPAGRFHQPFFKPDWSPDALLSNNYLCHFTLIRRGLLSALGGFRAGFDGAQDYDLFLRAAEGARRIVHIPAVLYHWRVSSHSTAGAASQKPAAIESGARALRDALSRRGIRGSVETVGNGARYRVRRAILRTEKIAIIIPTRDRLELVKRCIESITARTDYPNYEIVIADNDSRSAETLDYYKTIPHRIVPFPGPFNYSAINNYAVRQVDAPWILFLNNDIEVINADWLTSMAEHIQRPEIGAVGAKLLFPDHTVQHAGVLLAEKGTASHAYCHAAAASSENGGHLQLIRNYSAVTAACMLTRRSLFEQAGGFDEMELAVTYNDVDYCLKLIHAGFQIVYTPFAQLFHYESASRGRGRSDPAEGRILKQRWPAFFSHDPYSNPNLGWDATPRPGEAGAKPAPG